MRSVVRSEDGFSLLEILIAVVILATGSVSVMAALGTSVVSTGVHRAYASAETVTRDYATAMTARANSVTTYNLCPSAAQLTPTSTDFIPQDSSNVDLYVVTIEAPPTKWSADSTDAVQYWIPDSTNYPNGTWGNQAACQAQLRAACKEDTAANGGYGLGANYKPPSSCDPGLQRVWVHVQSNSSTLPNGINDAHYINQYSRVLVRRYDAPAPT